MNTKRILFWLGFVVVLGLIIWGLIVAMNKSTPATGTARTLTVPVSETDHVIGSATAPVTLVEYSDFQCPACHIYFPVIERLVAEASSTVRLVYRHYPLPQHANAPLASQVSEAASKQGKFWEMYRLIFEHQADWENLSDSEARTVFAGYATKLGLNMTQYQSDVVSAEVKVKIRGDLEGGIAAGVNATPTFFVNGQSIQSPQNYDEFKKIIDAAAAAATK